MHLKNPTPVPKRMRPRMKDAREPDWFDITEGMAAMMIRMWPSVAMTMAT